MEKERERRRSDSLDVQKMDGWMDRSLTCPAEEGSFLLTVLRVRILWGWGVGGEFVYT